MTDDYGMFSNLVPSVEEKEDDDYGMFADLVPSVDTKAKAKDYGMFADLVPSVETAVTPQLEAQSQHKAKHSNLLRLLLLNKDGVSLAVGRIMKTVV